MYASPDFKTKKDFKAAVKAGKKVRLYNPGPLGTPTLNGSECVEGPAYKMHTWYAQVEVKDGIVVKVS